MADMTDVNATVITTTTLNSTTVNSTNIIATAEIKNNLITLGSNGTITSLGLNSGSLTIDHITTSSTNIQTINGSTINIGYNGLNSVYIGNYNTAVYVNNVLLVPFNSASSFMSQW